MNTAPGPHSSTTHVARGPVSLSELRPILEWVRERTGLVFPRARRTHALRALRQLVREQQLDPATLVNRAASEPELLDALCNALTIAESYFFRIPEQYEAIEARVLAELPTGQGLRCWSAGCSEGQEIYSLAMLLDERGLLSRSELWATDLSPRVLSFARKARYRPWALRGPACQPLRAMLGEDVETFEVSEHLRKAVRFEHDNLVSDLPGPGAHTGFDLIMCRHVLIYLDEDAVAQVARRLFAALRPGGWLFCAPADPLLFEHAPFEIVPAPGGLIYRRPLATTESSKAIPPALRPTFTTPPDLILAPTHPPLIATPPLPETDTLRRAYEAFDARNWAKTLTLLDTPETRTSPDAILAALLRIRTLANINVERAQERTLLDRELLQHHPHYHYELARQALARRDDDDALRSARRALYLQPDFLMAHHLLAIIWNRLKNTERARRSLSNLRQRCGALPPEHPVELGEGRRVRDLLTEVDIALDALTPLELADD